MTQLTPTQQDLLSAIVAAGDGGFPTPDGRKKAVADLTRKGLVISVPQSGAPSRLMITQAGLASIGVDDNAMDRELPPAINQQIDSEQQEANPPGEVAEGAAAKSKIAMLVTLLRQPDGATIDDMMTATGWQAHSVRGAISGGIKKKLGHAISSEKTERGRAYRIDGGAEA